MRVAETSWATTARRCCATPAALLAALVLTAVSAAAQPFCPCDCNHDGRVIVAELVLSVRIALGSALAGECSAADRTGDGRVDVAELVAGVAAALGSCPAIATATVALPPTSTATAANATPTDTEAPTRTVSLTATSTASPTATPRATESPTMTGTAASTATSTPRPNFLVINLDDTRPDGLDGMAVVQSRLLPDSVQFPNSFVPLSSCCSSRASLLTGLYAVHHGTRQVAGPIGGAKTFRRSGSDRQTIAVWLHDAGYATGLFGKYLNEYDFEKDKGPGGTYYIPPGWSRWGAFVVEHYGGEDGPDYQLVDEHGVVTDYTDHTSDAQYSTGVTATMTRQFIADSVAAGQPFFAVWTPYASHGDGAELAPIPARAYLDTFADLPLFRPPNWGEPDRSDKPRWEQALVVTPVIAAVNDVVRQRAYETLRSVDDEIGHMLDDLDALGVAGNTLVLLTSDNGTAWGEHAQFGQRKACPYEECLRVPFMVRFPGALTPATAMTTALNIDVAPTLADFAGIDVPVDVDGQTLRPALAGVPGLFRDNFLLEQWREIRTATVAYTGQPADGDRLRLYYGAAFPRLALTFEFDAGDGVTPGTVPIAIGDTADGTYGTLGATAVAALPNAAYQLDSTAKKLTLRDTTAAAIGFYWWAEANQAGAFTVSVDTPDFFGVRDVLNGYTYVQYETGEVELYDLTTDPWQLQSVAADPAYDTVRSRLDARMRVLADLP